MVNCPSAEYPTLCRRPRRGSTEITPTENPVVPVESALLKSGFARQRSARDRRVFGRSKVRSVAERIASSREIALGPTSCATSTPPISGRTKGRTARSTTSLSPAATKDGDEWKSSYSFGREDLPLVCKALDHAHTWIFQQA